VNHTPLRVLVVDDERPALDELAYLLGKDERVGPITPCGSASEALRVLNDEEVDAIFLDVAMPGLSGLDLATVLARFKEPPPVVFVTAHMEHAVEAFDLAAVDYLLKPVREERLREAVRRICESGAASGSHLVRLALGSLEERWGGHGFVRIHRSLLVSLAHVDEVRVDNGRCSVLVSGTELTVSRRHTPALRELLRRHRQGAS
jgi:DNA-binding LytR/AlgR family response regulator